MNEIIIEKEIKKVYDEEVCLIIVKGSVDSNNFTSFKNNLTAIVEEPNKAIVIDLSDLQYLNSTGFGLFATLFRKTSREGRQLVLAALSPRVYHIFKLMGFNHMMITYPTVEEAIESLS